MIHCGFKAKMGVQTLNDFPLKYHRAKVSILNSMQTFLVEICYVYCKFLIAHIEIFFVDERQFDGL